MEGRYQDRLRQHHLPCGRAQFRIVSVMRTLQYDLSVYTRVRSLWAQYIKGLYCLHLAYRIN